MCGLLQPLIVLETESHGDFNFSADISSQPLVQIITENAVIFSRFECRKVDS